MGRRTSLASLAGAKVEDVPGRGDAVLISLPLEKLHCTRFNPRRNFGTEAELREFGEKLKKEQLQPAVVVSRAAYLKLWPSETERVGSASYVIANGERRYRASQLIGLPTIEVVHREDVAKPKANFLDAVQSENNDRRDLDPIERAIATETMVTELGGADQVAAYYGKTKGWVSQQRKLLKLAPDLQDVVSSGEMPVRVAREIAGLPQGAQVAAWKDELERRRVEKQASAQLRAQAKATPTPPQTQPPAEAASQRASNAELFTAANRSGGAESSSPLVPDSTPVPGPRHDHAAEADGPAAQGNDGQPRRLPYHDPFSVVTHLHLNIEPKVFTEGARVWLRILREQHPDAYGALLQELAQQGQLA